MTNPAFYHMLYNESPVSIWVEDFSQVYQCILDFKNSGVSDLRAYFSTYPEKLMDCVSRLRVVDVNNSTLRLYKAQSKEHLFTNLDKVFQQESIACLRESILALAEGKRTFESQGVNYDLDGNRIVFRMSWTVPGPDLGDMQNVIVVIQDMTRLSQIRTELEEREALFRCIFEQASEGMLLVDSSGKIILVNNAMANLTMLSIAEIIGEYVWDIHARFISKIHLLGEQRFDKNHVMEALQDTSKTTSSIEYRFADYKHKLHAHRQTIVPIKTAKENLFAIIVTDISPAFRSETSTRIMHHISHSVNITASLDDLFSTIHKALGELVDVTNFYIALYDKKSNLITFPYLVDEMNEDPSPIEADDSKSLTVQV
ncbi:MAG: PAS domain S-box protein, partial [Candidatus Cloacimonadaceae bacterium]|nr:PAS domain S-box protein [Candidatus Cloacimonadaceae bacterium]